MGSNLVRSNKYQVEGGQHVKSLPLPGDRGDQDSTPSDQSDLTNNDGAESVLVELDTRLLIMRGCLDPSIFHEKTSVRLFVCSTFTDTEAERNYMAQNVFPQIRAFCRAQGLTFDALDLRWGINRDITNSQTLLEICLQEVALCEHHSIDVPWFILICGSKYGYRPLPRQIPHEEFLSLIQRIDDVYHKALITKWYISDENAVPAVHTLQPLSRYLSDFLHGSSPGDSAIALSQWVNEEARIRTCLYRAARESALTEEQRKRWNMSIAEKEFQRCLALSKEREPKCLTIFRNIPDLEDLKHIDTRNNASSFIDLDIRVDSTEATPSVSCQRQLSNFKEFVETKCAEKLEYNIDWNENGISEDTHFKYLKAMGSNMQIVIKKRIEDHVKRKAKWDCLSSEVASHLALAYQRATHFCSRQDLLNVWDKYISQAKSGKTPLVFFGGSGTGKSTLLSVLAVRLTKIFSRTTVPVVVVRFCGTTPRSSNSKHLQRSICHQLSCVYANEIGSIRSKKVLSLKTEFEKILSKASKEKPLYLFLDDVDMLESRCDTALNWVPTVLPPYVYMVISMKKSHVDVYQTFCRRVGMGSFVNISTITEEDCKAILEVCLKEAKRVLQPHQWLTIVECASSADKEQPTVLRVYLLCKIALAMASYDEVVTLPASTKGLIHMFLDQLEHRHGHKFVAGLFALLAAAKFGLPEADLVDMLSCSDDVLNEVFQYDVPSRKQLPSVSLVWLLQDADGYIRSATVCGTRVVCLAHVQFQKVCKARYLQKSNGDLKRYSRLLAEYYSGELSQRYPERNISLQPLIWGAEDPDNSAQTLNMCRILELPSALTQANMWNELDIVLSDPHFICAKFHAGFGDELLKDFVNALDLEQSLTKKTLSKIAWFISEQFEDLQTCEKMPLITAVGYLDQVPVFSRTINLKDNGTTSSKSCV